jgi:hypothetical protein
MNKPIYISLTSIFQNQSTLLETLKSVKNQDAKINKCYIYLSENKYLLDNGFKEKKITYEKLNTFLNENCDLFEIRWVVNTGPYRKLLPLLREKWYEDCLIITIDDDTEYNPKLVTDLTMYYYMHNCIINFRGFTLKKTDNNLFSYTNRIQTVNLHKYNFFTGKGGVLYHPSFFHKTKDLVLNFKLYLSLCKTTDDVWFNVVRMCNDVNCFVVDYPYMLKDNTTDFGLFKNYNSKNDLNTITINNTIKELRKLGFTP